MRGKVNVTVVVLRGNGITPAYAGKSPDRILWEHWKEGSPPHVRGKGSTNGGSSWSQRITPACAGKRVEFYAERHKDQDHPRMCGEKLASGLSLRRMTGSPPHVRGKASHRGLVWELPGITPACAGKRQSPSGSHRLSLDHPRMCGEKCLNSLMVAPVTGSPPHVRGKGDSEVISQCTHGITPACAGKRLKRFRSTVSPVAIVPLFPSVCNKPVVSDGSPAGRDAPLFLPAENAVPASPAYNLRSL